MKTIKRIGTDVGNDALKIVLEDGSKFEVMNLVSPGYERRILGAEKGHPSNLLDVNIEVDGKSLGRYFVGGLAFKENRGDLIERTAVDVKATNMDTIIILMAGLAYANYDPSTSTKVVNVALGTVLPTEEYFRDNYRLVDELDKRLKRTYKVKFNSSYFNFAEITINVVDVDIKPECASATLAYTYNMDGSLKTEMEKSEEEIHLGIDIGSITTDISVVEYGQFNPRGFIGLSIGTAEPLDKIAADIKNTEGVMLHRHQLDYVIRNNKKLLVNSKDITDELSIFKENRFNNFAKLLANRIFKELSTNGIEPSFINRVNMFGGGAILLIDYFSRYFGMKNIGLVKDARYANASGSLISILQKTSEIEAAAAEVLEE